MKIVMEGYVYQEGLFGFWYRRFFKLCDDGNLLGYYNSRLETQVSIIGHQLATSESGSKLIFTVRDEHGACVINLYVQGVIERQLWTKKITAFHTQGEYKLVKLLGKGSFGKVFLCKLKNTEQEFAMKVTDIARNFNQFDLENQLLLTINHPFLMSANTSFKTDHSHCFVMKFLIGGDMRQFLHQIGKLTEDHARFYGAEIVSAVGHLHTLGIVHRDVKLENLMMDEDGHILLGDYGLSVDKMKFDSMLTEFKGTPAYMAPEMFDGCYGRAIDWWATGVVLYRMMLGKFPPFQMKRAVDLSFVSFETKQLLLGLLTKSPGERLGSSSAGNLEIQSHPFFAPVDWNKLNAKLIPTPYRPSLPLPPTESVKDAVINIFTRLSICNGMGGQSRDVDAAETHSHSGRNRQ